LGKYTAAALLSASQADDEKRQKDWADAERLYERWVEVYGGEDRGSGLEGHYAEGLARFLLGVNKRQRVSKLRKAERDRIQEQMESLLL
jgi:hypothetical protein